MSAGGYAFTVPGRAIPAARMTQRSKWSPRARRSLGYQETVAYAAIAAGLPRPLPWEWIGIGVRVYLKGVRKRKKDPVRLPLNAGDADNFLKGVVDGAQYAGVLANDRAVVYGQVRLIPCRSDDEQRVEVELWQEEALLDEDAD